MFFWAERADTVANLFCCKSYGKGKRKFWSKTKQYASQDWIPAVLSIICRLMNMRVLQNSLRILISHMNMSLNLIILLPEHTCNLEAQIHFYRTKTSINSQNLRIGQMLSSVVSQSTHSSSGSTLVCQKSVSLNSYSALLSSLLKIMTIGWNIKLQKRSQFYPGHKVNPLLSHRVCCHARY